MGQRIAGACAALVLGLGMHGVGLAQDAGGAAPAGQETTLEATVVRSGAAWDWKTYGGVFGSTTYEVEGVARLIEEGDAVRLGVEGLSVSETGRYTAYLSTESPSAVRDKNTPRGKKLGSVRSATSNKTWNLTASEADGARSLVVFHEDKERVAGVLALTQGEVVSWSHSWGKAQKKTRGGWEIVKRESGVFLRFASDFKTARPPEPLSVLLSTRSPSGVNKRNAESGSLKVGTLRSHEGAQELRLPDDVDLDGYASLVLWCKPYEVVFGVATLEVESD